MGKFILNEVEFNDAMAKQLGLPKRMPVIEAEISTEFQRKLQVVTVKFPRLWNEPDE